MIQNLKQFKDDFSISTLVAACIVVIVGMTSSAIVVFQAANAFGANASEASSWLGSLCLGMGLLTIYLSFKYKSPVLLAWSTPGAALLIGSAQGISLSEATGAFIFSAVLIFLSGVTGLFEKMMNRIPLSLAAGLLAGVLLNFSVSAFTSFNTQPILLCGMIATYVVCKKYYPHWAMLGVLIVGIATAAFLKELHFDQFQILPTDFIFTKPEFKITSLIGIGLPLFIVTMASQNLTGITIMRSYGYENPTSKILTQSGLLNIITAFFGGFTVNLAAITAAIAMSPESHPDKEKRYVAGVISGVIYVVIGIMAGTVTSVFAAFPKELVAGIAGLALLGTVAANLQKSFYFEHEKEAAFITFIIAASGFKFLNIGSAFWALAIGLFVQFTIHRKNQKS